MKKDIKAVLFDLDGTLLDTLEDLTDSVNAALVQYHRPTRTIEEVRTFVGNGVLKLMERAVEEGPLAEDFQEIYIYFKQHYAAHSQEKTKPYDGIIEMLHELKRQGYKMGIVSNKFHDAVCDLNRLYFKDLISVAIGENESAGVRKKPAPDTVFAALEALGVSRDEAIYVGDSEVDAETARQAGIPCILVAWGFRDLELLSSFNPVCLARNAEDILLYLKN